MKGKKEWYVKKNRLVMKWENGSTVKAKLDQKLNLYWIGKLSQHTIFVEGKPHKVRIGTAILTPAQADYHLKRRPYIRDLNKNNSIAYSHLMHSEKWVPTHQGLAFDAKNMLVDGQKRCLASVASKKPFCTLVTLDLPDECVLAIDNGEKRAVDSNLGQIWNGKRGIEKGLMKGVGPLIGNIFSNDGISMQNRQKSARLPSSCIPPMVYDDLFNHYSRSISMAQWIFRRHRHMGTNTAFVKSAVAKSLETKPRKSKRIQLFAEILATGEMRSPKDQAAIKLRNYLLSNYDRSGGKKTFNYLLTARCLEAFIAGKRLDKLQPAAQDPFPLPKPAISFLNIDRGLMDRTRTALKLYGKK